MSSQQQQKPPNTILHIIVSNRPFQISWKSLESDGPHNFFTRHFLKTKSNTIHIDRSPDTFAVIAKHLRGYPVVARTECEHQDLLNDAHFYGLEKLTRLLNNFIHVNVGSVPFRLRWDLFRREGSNYFTGPLRHSLMSPHPAAGESPPMMIERDPETFRDLVRHLQGYHLEIRDNDHRLRLLEDAQFYMFRRLRDRLRLREDKDEVLMYLEDLKPSMVRGAGCELDGRPYSTLLVQLNNVNARWEKENGEVTMVVKLEQELRLVKDPSWLVSPKVTLDADCAILMNENVWNVTKFLEQQQDASWLGIEKSIAKVSLDIEKRVLSLSMIKMQVVLSRTEANMKCEFL
ncbi:MAG: hypothetical protein EXX96DRAFT_548383 [Benjaminiella poitrasii]|nr:MAG: hypothetical protein EXX96DRAFT_548383 [Benjaminiella poitrasii]